MNTVRKVRGRRLRVVAVFAGTLFTEKFHSIQKEIAEFVDIREENGNVIADELFLNYTWGFVEANMERGDIVTFFARIKFCKDEEEKELGSNYTLIYPTQIKILKREKKSAKKR